MGFRRRIIALLAGIVLVAGCGGAFWWWKKTGSLDLPPPDFSGPPGPEIVLHIAEAPSPIVIGDELTDQKVVKSRAAFLAANLVHPTKIAPGYYVVHTNLPAKQALAELGDLTRRRGHVELARPGVTIDGVHTSTNEVNQGIYDAIALASCVPADEGQHCVSADELKLAGASASLDELSVPEWAREGVESFPDGIVPKDRRIEGLIGAGVWDFDPKASPVEILRSLIAATTAKYQELGITSGAKALGWTPYQVLIGASLIEREVYDIDDDMPRAARVVLNRLDAGMPLGFDATINYVLRVTDIATSDEARSDRNPWNTYVRKGLTPAPISSPEYAAIKAMLHPEEGGWLYFVAVTKDGRTAFANTYDEHLKNVVLAHENGVF